MLEKKSLIGVYGQQKYCNAHIGHGRRDVY